MLGHCVCARTWICTVYSCTPRHTQCCGRGHAAGNLHSTYYNIQSHIHMHTYTNAHIARTTTHTHTHPLAHTHRQEATHTRTIPFFPMRMRACVCARTHTRTHTHTSLHNTYTWSRDVVCRCLALGLWCVIEMGQEGRRGGSGAHFSTTAKVVVEFTCFSPL